MTGLAIIPEPSTALLLGFGLLELGIKTRMIRTSAIPPVIVVASPSVLTFDFDFHEPLGSNDEFSAVLFSVGPEQGPFFGQLERLTVQSSQMGSGSFDLSP